MTIVALSNDALGFETSCFVCDRTNELGLQIPFFHDTERETVYADFVLADAHSGAPTMAHGGVLLAIADEAMGWATIALARQWAVTLETATTFVAPVFIDQPHRVQARVAGVDGDQLRTEAEIVDNQGRVSATTTATFHALSPTQVDGFAGTVVGDVDEAYEADGS